MDSDDFALWSRCLEHHRRRSSSRGISQALRLFHRAQVQAVELRLLKSDMPAWVRKALYENHRWRGSLFN
jgi:hypothetical protein